MQQLCYRLSFCLALLTASLSLGHLLPAQEKLTPAKKSPQKRLEPWQQNEIEYNKLRGTWGVVASEENGEVTRYEQPADFWRFGAHDVREWLPDALQSKRYPLYRAEILAKPHKWLDLLDLSPARDEVFVRCGLYQLKDDTLVWTYTQDWQAKNAKAKHAKVYETNLFHFNTRPTKLRTARGDGLVSLTLQRVTDKLLEIPPEDRPDYKAPPPAEKPPAEPTDWEQLQGTWGIVGWEEAGVERFYASTAGYYQFRGQECREWNIGDEQSRLTPLVRHDASGKVKRLDEIKIHPPSGELYYWGGSYELKGDTFSWTQAQTNGLKETKVTLDKENHVFWGPRPSRISTAAGDGLLRWIMKRITDKEAALTPEDRKSAAGAAK